MSDGDRAINDSLAGWLFDVAMKQKTGPTLDIGAALPVLASRLAKRGCLAYAMEGDTLPDLGGDESLMVVNRVNADFEKIDGYMDGTWSLITFIHAWEHIYRPIEAMKKLRRMIHNSGKLFIRMPDHGVPGYERDMNPGHYSIHPMYYSFTAILQLCVQTESFEVEFSMPMLPGQRDMILAPI
jgi:2-polyprenyl-3-methyl-5-hydroxy-6-metoxy-1,4-benzoquinol methylase